MLVCSIENSPVRMVCVRTYVCIFHIPHIVLCFNIMFQNCFRVPNCSCGHGGCSFVHVHVGVPAQTRLQRQRQLIANAHAG